MTNITKTLAETRKEMNSSTIISSLTWPLFIQSAFRAAIALQVALLACLAIIVSPVSVQAQSSAQAGSADNALRSGMRVDPSTRGLNIQIPIRVYPGRAGMSVPITLNYSSKVWRMENVGVYWSACGGENGGGRWVTKTEAKYGLYSASGWTTSLGIPQIEWPKDNDVYNWNGQPVCLECHSPQWSAANYWVIDRLYLHMPDGSTHELRKGDTPHQWPIDKTGKFYAIDGSRLIYDADNSILYMADGSRYEIGSATTKLIDRNGNTLVYNHATAQWTDTLGRTIPALAPGTTSLLGVGNSPQNYTLNWTSLSEARTDPNQSLKYNGEVIAGGTPGVCGDPPGVPSPGSLWDTSEDGSVIQTSSQPFNPVVLHEIVFPNGSKYRFTYNVYGEIDKIELPTGGTEEFTYELAGVISESTSARTNRGVKDHRIRPVSGSSAGEQHWQYSTSHVLSQDQTYAIYKMKETAPDGSYSERYLFNGPPPPDRRTGTRIPLFGFDDVRNGRTFDEQVFSSTGQLLRRKLTEWVMSPIEVWGPVPPHPGLTRVKATATRSPKVTKEVSIVFDTGTNPLSTMTTYEYGQVSQPLNLTSTTRYGFSTLDPTTAQTGPVESFSPNPSLAIRTTQTSYLEHADYTARNLVALPLVSTTRSGGASGPVVSQSIVEYDEAAYPLFTYGAVSGWTNPNTTARGNVTTAKRLKDVAANSYITTHTRYDQCGSVRESIDARGSVAQVDYTDSFVDQPAPSQNTYAYPTTATSPVPDPANLNGSNIGLTTTTKYDYQTGLVVSAKDANLQIVTFSYKDEQGNTDPLNRLRKVSKPDGGWTRYEFNDLVDNLYTLTESKQDDTRTVKVYQYYDSLGRSSRALMSEGLVNNVESYIASDVKYDQLGRVCSTSDPYRTQTRNGAITSPNDCAWAANWATTTYDQLGRTTKITLPDGTTVQTEYLGIYTTRTDQAGKQRRQKVDALGRIVRVDEPDLNGVLGAVDAPAQATYYEYDALGNLVHVLQGASPNIQHRYFKYDSLSRLTHEKQVEQAAIFSATDPLTSNSEWSRRIVYDENGYEGLITSQYDARNIHTQYSYDYLNRITGITYSDGVTPSVSYIYDKVRFTNSQDTRTIYNLGRLAEVQTGALGNLPATSQSYNYDLMGRVANNRQSVGTNSYQMIYGYNAGGSLTSEQYPSGRVVAFDYGDAGRLQSVTSGGTTYASQFKYEDSRGLLTSFLLGNANNLVKESYTYNSRLQLQSSELAKGSSVLQKYDYKYGKVNADGSVDETKNNGQIGRIEGYIGADKQWQQRFSYDSLGRLSQASEYRGDNGQLSYRMTYEYDQFGNRYQKSANNPTNGSDGQTTPQSYVAVEEADINKLTNRFITGIGISYDNAGNLTSDSRFTGRQYLYDANNRQRQVSHPDGTNAFTSVYDGLGQRVAAMTGSTIDNLLVYDAGGKLVAEYGPNAINRGTSYIFTDHQSSTRALLDSAGTVISRHDYQPFGAEISSGVGQRTTTQKYGQADSARQKYAGMETDDGAANSHTLWRKYDSSSGRWTSPDPYSGSMTIADPQSFNRYNYVQNDPVNLIDPLGLAPFDIGIYQTMNPEAARTAEREMVTRFRNAISTKHRESPGRSRAPHGGASGGGINYAHGGSGQSAQDGSRGQDGSQQGTSQDDEVVRINVEDDVLVFNINESAKRAVTDSPPIVLVMGAAGNPWGHVAYIIDGKVYSWERLRGPYVVYPNVGQYIRTNTSYRSVTAYELDFGTVYNIRFKELLLGAYDNNNTYDPIRNNCGEACNKAINGLPFGLYSDKVKPADIARFIETRLGQYIKSKTYYPRR